MPETIEVIEELSIIRIKSVGTITEIDLSGSRIKVKELCETRGFIRILVDATEQHNISSLFTAFQHAKSLSAEEYFRKARHAIIFTEKTKDDLLFIETVASNRGINLKTFPTEDAAVSWLMS